MGTCGHGLHRSSELRTGRVTDRSTVQRRISTAVGDVDVNVLTADKTTDDGDVAVQRRPDQQLGEYFAHALGALDARQRADALPGDDGVDRERDAAGRGAMSHHVPLRSHARRRVVPRRLSGGDRDDVPPLPPSVDHHVAG